MKIVLLADALDTQHAGIHVYVRELLSAVVATDRENEYFIVRPGGGGEAIPGAKEIIVPIRPGLPGHQRWRQFREIPRRMVREKADVVVETAHFGPFNLPARIRRVTILHDLTPVLFPAWHTFGSGLAHRLLLPGILKKADAVIVNSRYTQSDVERRYPVSRGKVSVVSPGREAGFFPKETGADPSENAAVFQKYGIRKPYLLCVGTLEPRKNLSVLLAAYEQFRRQGGAACQLVLAGKTGWKNTAFFKQLKASPFRREVVLTGYAERAELPVLYSGAAFFVYPSLYEGFGLPVLEAMSCGAPVLVSHASSLPEVGGEAAVYFDPDSPAELAEKMAALLGDNAWLRRLGELAQRRAAGFSWERAAGEFVAVMNRFEVGV